jgi:hypothetical protein
MHACTAFKQGQTLLHSLLLYFLPMLLLPLLLDYQVASLINCATLDSLAALTLEIAFSSRYHPVDCRLSNSFVAGDGCVPLTP